MPRIQVQVAGQDALGRQVVQYAYTSVQTFGDDENTPCWTVLG